MSRLTDFGGLVSCRARTSSHGTGGLLVGHFGLSGELTLYCRATVVVRNGVIDKQVIDIDRDDHFVIS